MKIKLIILSIIALFCFIAVPSQAANLAGETDTISSGTVTNIATTTLTLVTALSGRTHVIIRVTSGLVTSNACYVAVGAETVTDGTGTRVDYNTPLEFDAGPGVPIAIISSGAAALSVIQLGRP